MTSIYLTESPRSKFWVFKTEDKINSLFNGYHITSSDEEDNSNSISNEGSESASDEGNESTEAIQDSDFNSNQDLGFMLISMKGMEGLRIRKSLEVMYTSKDMLGLIVKLVRFKRRRIAWDDDDDVLDVLILDSSIDERKSLEVMCTSKDMLGLIVKLVRFKRRRGISQDNGSGTGGDPFLKDIPIRVCSGGNIPYDRVADILSEEGSSSPICLGELWSNSPFCFASKNSNGKSGGIIAIWDTSSFTSADTLKGDCFLAIKGTWKSLKTSCLMIIMYAPQSQAKKIRLWSELTNLILDHDNLTIVMGDFNETQANLNALTSEFSNHSPLLLTNRLLDYGPIPFKFYNSWMMHKDFKSVISSCWTSIADIRPFNNKTILLKRKLQGLKACLKNWRQTVCLVESASAVTHHARLDQLDLLAESGCGGDKAPGPDGFTFKFIKNQWDLLGNDIISFVREFESFTIIPRGCNSSLITLVPKIDDPIVIGDFRPISLIGCQYKILAKVLANCLAQVISSVVSEVDFEKAFDTLSWSFLDSIMSQMGFSSKWRNWIKACLNSAYASVLINGSPLTEFKVERGEDKTYISHLQFVDDALIMGECSLTNTMNLSRILTCFHLASGLKVNFNKSKLFGVGVTPLEVKPSQFPCIYLGIPIGSKKENRQTLEYKKKFLLGRLFGHKKNSWIPWDKALSPLNQGGLGICSLKVGNGESTRFWLDNWIGGGSLNVSYPRLFRLEVNKNCLVRDRAPTLIQHPTVSIFVPISSLSSVDSSFSGANSSLLGVVTATGPIYLSGANSSLLGAATATGLILPPGLHFEWTWSRALRS
ncbi:RNA-directed DNA polymerase, eukaryota, reverse transcriptase zinc-binding domain protein [Tanacetum coccineum]|uniref:RNA-directed DNA polymerase, eukaryota, reverse transcriptase zinc-binding domain protein n=1 Tax=Tanacetum coccineum TaxID=301880 RepID=A0ABQ4WSH8_9ASTR